MRLCHEKDLGGKTDQKAVFLDVRQARRVRSGPPGKNKPPFWYTSAFSGGIRRSRGEMVT